MKKFVDLVRRGFRRCKACAVALACALGLCSPAMAEGEAGASAFDTTIVSELSGKLQATMTSFWTDNKNVLMLCIGIIVALSLVWLVIKVFKRGTSRA